MKRLVILCFLVMTLLVSSRTMAQPGGCVSCYYGCNDCACTCEGADLCNGKCNSCMCGSPSMDLNQVYDTGIRLMFQHGKWFIADIATNSPAAGSGLRIRDEILSVEAIQLTPDKGPLIEPLLQSSAPGIVTLRIRRTMRTLEFHVPREPLLRILNRAWISENGFHASYSGESIMPFVAGIRLSLEDDRALVRAMLPWSPGAEAGLKLGDEVLSINGKAVAVLGLQGIEAALQGYRSCPIQLEVNHRGGDRQMTFRLQGLTRLVKNVLFASERPRKTS